jgi:hypothetical protein
MVAIGKVVFTSREHVIALEARDKGLLGVTLRYPYEVRKEEEYFDGLRFLTGKHHSRVRCAALKKSPARAGLVGLCRMCLGTFMVEREVTTVDPSATDRAADEMLGLVRGRIANTFADACGLRNIDHALVILPA